MWPPATLILPVWPRDAKRLDIPARGKPPTFGEKKKKTFLVGTNVAQCYEKITGFRPDKYMFNISFTSYWPFYF